MARPLEGVPDGLKTVPLAELGVVALSADVVPVYWLLGLVPPAMPLERGIVELDNGNGGAEDVSGDEDGDKIGVTVPTEAVALPPDTGTVEFEFGYGGDTVVEVLPDGTEAVLDEPPAGEVPV